MNVNNELIHFYAKQLKIPTFANYTEVLRQADPASDFSQLLLELMKAEAAARQENQNRRRLKSAGFPYLKTIEEFDCNQLNDAVSPLFLKELASCQFVAGKQNVIMIGNPGRGKTHLAIALGLKAPVRKATMYYLKMLQLFQQNFVRRRIIIILVSWNEPWQKPIS